MTIILIAAISSNSGLGVDNNLLFNIEKDMKFFRDTTEGQICVFGRKTYESILEMNNGIPLKNRTSVILTRDENYESNHGVQSYTDVQRILNHHKTMGDKDKKVIICGGSEIYNLFMPFATETLITHVNKHLEEANIFYNMQLQIDLGFVPIEESEEFYTEKYDAYYKFVRYTKQEKQLDEE